MKNQRSNAIVWLEYAKQYIDSHGKKGDRAMALVSLELVRETLEAEEGKKDV